MLTPHAGELARLLETDSEAIGARRLESARRAAREAQAIIVLKGDDTLVAGPDGRVGVSRGGAPALATAGTGDVLSGVVGACWPRGWIPSTPRAPACSCMLAPGCCRRRRSAPEGVIAGDVIAALPRALRASG